MTETHRVTHRETKIKKQNAEMTFVEHLDVLRAHIIKSILAVIFFAVIAFLFKNIIFDEIILKPKEPSFITNRLMCQAAKELNSPALCINTNELKIVNIELAGQFKAHLIVSLLFGFIVAFPYILLQLWRFFRPALKKQEKIYAGRMIFSVTLLFFFGVLFGYFVIVPLAVNFLANYNISEQVHNTINFASYFSTVTTTSFGTGLIFEIPALAYVLAKIGLITPDLLKKYRKHAIALSFLLSAIVTPPDVFSQILVAFPIMFLYEFSITIVKKVYKKRTITL
jgi:sec-independent protein translocase protein TatC